MRGTKVKGELMLFLTMIILTFLWGGIVGYMAHIVVHDAFKRNICEAVK
jgi:hypothetical protein